MVLLDMMDKNNDDSDVTVQTFDVWKKIIICNIKKRAKINKNNRNYKVYKNSVTPNVVHMRFGKQKITLYEWTEWTGNAEWIFQFICVNIYIWKYEK